MSQERQLEDRLDRLFLPWNRSDQPGLSVGVARNGNVIYRRGFGLANLASGVVISEKTRLHIASITKHFVCLLALLLNERGLLDIDAPIGRYLPELRHCEDVTLRLLMQHRSGLRDSANVGFICHGLASMPPGVSGLERQAKLTGKDFPPGNAMLYNNGGYLLIATAVARAGGRSIREQLYKELVEPLGMSETVVVTSNSEIVRGLATGYVRGADGWQAAFVPRGGDDTPASGTIVSNIDDMLRWTAHMRRRDRFGTESTWRDLTEPPYFADGTRSHYAFGLITRVYRGTPTLEHSGATFGGTSQMLTFPDYGLDVVILANGAPNASAVALADQVADIVLENELGAASTFVLVSDIPAAIGRWWSDETSMLYGLVDEDAKVKLTINGEPAVLLERLADGRAVMHARSLGPVFIDFENLTHRDELTIAFGGKSARYRKLPAEAEDKAAFHNAAVGTYFCPEAECTAMIVDEAGCLKLTFTDAIGQFVAKLRPLSDRVAVSEPVSPFELVRPVLTLICRQGTASAFCVNTIRTRNLVFERS